MSFLGRMSDYLSPIDLFGYEVNCAGCHAVIGPDDIQVIDGIRWGSFCSLDCQRKHDARDRARQQCDREPMSFEKPCVAPLPEGW